MAADGGLFCLLILVCFSCGLFVCWGGCLIRLLQEGLGLWLIRLCFRVLGWWLCFRLVWDVS